MELILLWDNFWKNIFLYYEKFFLKVQEKNYHYWVYELSKIEKIVNQNHDSTYKWFQTMIDISIWNIHSKKINENIRYNISNINDMKALLWNIYNSRNKIAHNSEFYFKTNKMYNLI